MSEPKRISPMLDNFAMGDPISDHNGVRCCPAMDNATGDKYIVKIISVPASQSQLDALLLSGAYPDRESAEKYFREMAGSIEDEVKILQNLAQLEGYLPFDSYQTAPMEGESGFDVYLLSKYRNTLHHQFRKGGFSHLGAINLGLDLCNALSVCRRCGYLYINLKPDNIYLADEQSYRIGDIGFMKLNSLKYASLPERYRSSYTAPEIADAYASLNTTVDIYALGLVLFQIYNDGQLPALEEDGSIATAPAYADYEMAEIILKACHINPEERWQDPVEMGQALVSYMQRNGANDTPIAPVSNTNVEFTEDVPETPKEEVPELTPEEVTEEHIFAEDASGNLTFLEGEPEDETAPDQQPEEIDYDEVSHEVSEILNLADDLLAHPTPEPVVQPEPIDVPIPEPVLTDEAQEEEPEVQPEETLPEEVSATEETEEFIEQDEESEQLQEQPKKKRHWFRNIFLCVLFLGILTAGFFFYTRYYLQNIDAIVLEEKDGTSLVVNVTTKLDESKLSVICSDTYGNQLVQPVVNGQAKFTDLTPNAAYTVQVSVSGFHKLTGDISAAFTTPVQTNIVQFNAVTGSEDGSAVIGFTIDGPDAKQWCLTYSAANEEEKKISFAGHMVTVTGLTIGKEYTFALRPEEDILITGINQIKHTPSEIVKAKDLFITGLKDGVLTAVWSAPKDATIDSWTVRCYAEGIYDETKIVSKCNVEFTGIDTSKDFTLDVTAASMSVSERVFIPANSIAVSEFKATEKDQTIQLTWNNNGNTPNGGWKVLYSVDNSPATELTCKDDTAVTVANPIPGCSYLFTLVTAEGADVLGGKLRLDTADAIGFSGYGVKATDLTAKMCITPSKKNWDRYDLSSSDYTTEFDLKQKASFLVRSGKKISSSSDSIVTQFVIRDQNGDISLISSSTAKWKKMWSDRYCELNIPTMPSKAGKYSVSIYFNGALVHNQEFTMK